MRGLTAIAVLGWLLSHGAFGSQQIVEQEQRLMPGALSERDFFGRCVAISGDHLAVGANQDDGGSFNPDFDSGAVYVFERDGSSWNFDVRLDAAPTMSGVQAAEDFGRCVALAGSTLVVGAPGNRLAPNGSSLGVDAGAVYVFVRQGTSWVPEGPRLVGNGVVGGDHFGSSVALDGDTLAVGARFASSSGGAASAGRVHVFERSGTVWSEALPVLEASDAEGFDEFGTHLALSGTALVVGAPREDATTSDDSGAAYVFTRAGTVWSEEQKILPTQRCPFAQFGDCVAISGDRIAVGAPLRVQTATVSGSATVFSRVGSVWSEEVELFSSDLDDDDRFGDCLVLEGDRLWVGAWNDRHTRGMAGGPMRAVGSAYLFARDGSDWNESLKVVPADGEAGDRFGADLCVEGDRLVCGAWQKPAPNQLEGAAYAFRIQDVTPFDLCSGDGGDQLGCTNCPCGNNAVPGTVGGCLNSAGTSGRIVASGNASVSNDTLHFDLTGAPPAAFCILNSGNAVAPAGMGNPCFGLDSGILSLSFDGLRCAIQQTLRHGGRAADANGDVGLTNNGWGPPNNPVLGFSNQSGFVAGQSRAFQVIHRDDALLGCMRGLNTSQAMVALYYP